MELLVAAALSANRDRKSYAEDEHSAAMLLHHLFLAKVIVSLFRVVLEKMVSGWPHFHSSADCPCLWRSCGMGYRYTRRTCNIDPCGKDCGTSAPALRERTVRAAVVVVAGLAPHETFKSPMIAIGKIHGIPPFDVD